MDPGSYSQTSRVPTINTSVRTVIDDPALQKGSPRTNISSSFFKGKSRMDNVRSPIDPPSPRIPKLLTKSEARRGSGAGVEVDHTLASPITMSQPPPPAPSSQAKQRLATGSTFNNHYRSISRSMNDLGNIFSRGRSPPNRDVSPRRPPPLNTVQEGRKAGDRLPESPAVPWINVQQEFDNSIVKEGWVNMVDSHSVKRGPLKDAWRLQLAVVSNNQLQLYKPPSSITAKAFDASLPSNNIARPQTAPASATIQTSSQTIVHKSKARHPQLILTEDGVLKGGSVEALCHELVFHASDDCIVSATLALPAWGSPEAVLSMMMEYALMENCSHRVGTILETIANVLPGLLLESSCYNVARLLLERTVTPHDQPLAKSIREAIDKKIKPMKAALQAPPNTEEYKEPQTPRLEHNSFSAQLTAAEFLQLPAEAFANQVHVFHKSFLKNWNPADDLSVLIRPPHWAPSNYRNPLVFSSTHLHFLSERVISHTLSGDAQNSLRFRISVMTHWLRVAQSLSIKGDFAGWLAIAMGLLSPPVLRLQETWSALDPQLVEQLIDSGRLALRQVERRNLRLDDGLGPEPHVFIPDDIEYDAPPGETVPFFGDFIHCLDGLNLNGDRVDLEELVIRVEGALHEVSRWKKSGDNAQLNSPLKTQADYYDDEELQRCLNHLNFANQNPPSVNSALFYQMSIACEPPTTGMYLQSHYHERLPLDIGANIPLCFTDPMPRFSLFDRDDTLAMASGYHVKKSSATSLANSNFISTYPHAQAAPAQSTAQLATFTQAQQPTLRRTRSFPPSRSNTTGYDELDFTTRERTAGLFSIDKSVLGPVQDVAGVSQRIFTSKDEELVLKRLIEDQESRPASVIDQTNKRVSIASRRLSSHFQNSTGASPSHSVYGEMQGLNLNSQGQIEPPISVYDVVAKGGTLERLVDILVLGVEDFSKRMKRSDGENDDEMIYLTMDMNVFTITFFATFRSYCSPIVLLDYLKKRLLGSKSAAAISQNDSDDFVFPDWTGVDNASDDKIDWTLVAKIHIGILEALDLWIQEFFADFHSDQALIESFLAFMGVATVELEVWNEREAECDDPETRETAENVRFLFSDIKNKFARRLYTPLVYPSVDLPAQRQRLTIPIHGGLVEIDKLVDKFDISVRLAYKAIRLTDWMTTFEILESQSVDPLGFFLPKVALLQSDEDAVLQDIYYLLPRLRRTGDPNSSLLSVLPRPVRDLWQLHQDIGDWVIGQLADPTINVDARSRRMMALIRVISVSRRRMSSLDMYDKTEIPSSSKRFPSGIPSFVESAVVAALLRPESRAFSLAWFNATRDLVGPITQIDSIEQITPSLPPGEDRMNPRPLMPCAGWLIERMLEIICYVPNMLVESNRLINFDKRRFVYNLVNNLTHPNKVDRPSMSRDEEIPPTYSVSYDIDRKVIKEVATRENQSNKSGKIRVFWRLFYFEQDKLRRDKAQRESIDRQQRDQARMTYRRVPSMPTEVAKQKPGKRLAVNTFIKAVRPISMAFTNTRTLPHHPGKNISPFDLPPAKGIERSRKPTFFIDLEKIQSITCGKSSRQRLMWKIRGENGTAFMFQAVDEKELDEWLKLVSSIRGITVSDGNAESVDGITLLNAPRVQLPVFGVALAELVKRDGSKIPNVVEALLSEIERRGLSEIGIYRVGGSHAAIQALKAALDSGDEVRMDDDRWYDINAIAGTFKLFMRELPEPILSPEVLEGCQKVIENIPETDEENRIAAFRDIMLQQPAYVYHFMRRMYTHLYLINANADTNKMTAINLAIVFGMGLAPNTPFGISANFGMYQQLVRFWVVYAHEIFPPLAEENGSSVDLNSSESSPLPPSRGSKDNARPSSVDNANLKIEPNVIKSTPSTPDLRLVNKSVEDLRLGN